MFAEPEFWVAVAFVILMGVFVYFGIHRTVLTALGPGFTCSCLSLAKAA